MELGLNGLITSSPFTPPNGNYTIEGWSERLRAQYLMSLDPDLRMNDAMRTAEADLNFNNATCTQTANGAPTINL